MRIRKNANVSSYMNSHASGPDSFQTHVCQLNQSPWDVIPFSQHQTTYPFHQFEDEDSFNGNGSLVDSAGAVESVASMMEDISATTIINNVGENYADESHNKKRMLEEYEEIKVGTNLIKSNKKSHETKSWHFKNNSNNSSEKHHREASVTKKQEKTSSSQRGRGKTSGGKKGSGSGAGNPYEFYYYSGFGPSWGKRRGSDKAGELGNNSRQFLDDDLLALDEEASASPSQIEAKNSNVNNNGFDYVDEDEEEDNEDGMSGKKRMRKPVKARSLKSLM